MVHYVYFYMIWMHICLNVESLIIIFKYFTAEIKYEKTSA